MTESEVQKGVMKERKKEKVRKEGEGREGRWRWRWIQMESGRAVTRDSRERSEMTKGGSRPIAALPGPGGGVPQ